MNINHILEAYKALHEQFGSEDYIILTEEMDDGGISLVVYDTHKLLIEGGYEHPTVLEFLSIIKEEGLDINDFEVYREKVEV